MRILGVDYGTKRIGLAIGDESGLAIRAVRTIPSEGAKRDAHRLIEYAEELEAQTIVVGLPLHRSGARSPAARRSEKLVAQLQKLTPLPITLWDERLTSEAANQWMVEHNVKSSRRHILRDQIAACLILEDYLAHRRFHEANK
jgi:putative Holliday junction resolvase